MEVLFNLGIYVFTQPLYHDVTQSIFKLTKVSLNFFLLLDWLPNEPSLPWYLSIAEEKTDGFVSLLRTLVQSEIQTALSKIWTLANNSISYDNNHYAKAYTEIHNQIKITV